MKYLNDYAGSYHCLGDVEITEHSGNWVTGLVDGHWFQAKVFTKPSEEDYGIQGGRISKLVISKTDKWPGFYQDKLLFNYDRGLDFGSIDDELVTKILAAFPVED